MEIKTIAVICNDIDWTVISGYSFANGFYYKLSEKYFVKIIIPCVGLDCGENSIKYLNKNLTLKRIYPSYQQLKILESEARLNYLGHYCSLMFCGDDIKFQKELKSAVGEADAVICNSLFPYNLVRNTFPDKEIVYRSLDSYYHSYCDAHEWKIRSTPKITDETKQILNDIESMIFENEKRACVSSQYILSLTKNDKESMTRLYNVDENKFISMPICHEYAGIYEGFLPRKDYRKVSNCVLVSGNYFLAYELINSIINMAIKTPEINYHFVGSCCDSFREAILPNNCITHGIISESEKNRLLRISDCAFCIPKQTHGMNAKNWDYILYGIPMISDTCGVRGYNLIENNDYFLLDLNDLLGSFHNFINLSEDERRDIAFSAYTKSISDLNYDNYLHSLEVALGFNSMKNTCSTDVFIFGAHNTGYDCYYHIINRPEYNCIGFIDNRITSQGAEILGLKIFSPKEALEIAYENGAKVIIAMNRCAAIPEVYNQVTSVLKTENVWLFYRHVLVTENIRWERILSRNQ